ncbi:hypothetical protein ANN_26836 [Periplaneta americana]|uniref:CRAL-TRIO domain-containing protein n=1 Tax=Periplaneta americana TaxID=6978 RepID=A0ABQ8RZF2_PERAM|nr:hypothetical protein ANN_26836 [Periplaneta americana]
MGLKQTPRHFVIFMNLKYYFGVLALFSNIPEVLSSFFLIDAGAISSYLNNQIRKPVTCFVSLSGSLHEARLERWLIRCKNSMEKTKQSIDLYYTLKSLSPDLMCDWNPRSKWFQDSVQAICFFPMPELTPEGDRIIVIKYLTKDAINYMHEDLARVALMINEARMCEEYCFSDIYVLDMENYTLGHASRVTFTIAKKFAVCLMVRYVQYFLSSRNFDLPSFSAIFLTFDYCWQTGNAILIS